MELSQDQRCPRIEPSCVEETGVIYNDGATSSNKQHKRDEVITQIPPNISNLASQLAKKLDHSSSALDTEAIQMTAPKQLYEHVDTTLVPPSTSEIPTQLTKKVNNSGLVRNTEILNVVNTRQIPRETAATYIDNEIIVKPTSSSTNELRSEAQSNGIHNSDLTKYKHMVTVGIPIQSVVHKMKADRISLDLINILMTESDQNSKSNPEAIDNMVSHSEPVTIENNAPTIHGHVKGVEVSSKQSAFTKGEQLPNLQDDPSLLKYRKMIAVGIPIESVAHKMKADGISLNVIKVFLATAKGESDSKNHKMESIGSLQRNVLLQSNNPLTATSEVIKGSVSLMAAIQGKDEHRIKTSTDSEIILSASECKIIFEKDNQLSKFRKMASVGVPPQSIVNKMRQEGITDAQINIFEIAFGLKSTNQSSHQQNKFQQIGLPLPPQVARRTSVKMQKIHWKAVSEEKVGNSLWADTTDFDSDIDDKEVKQLESLFGATRTKPINNIKKQGSSNPQTMKNSCLIDMKRANNIAISLAQYRSYQNYDDLCSAVVAMDSSKLNAEQLQNMKALLPTIDELKKMKEYKGGTNGLVRAELFFLSVSKFPRFAQKLDTFIFSLLFNLHLKELQDSFKKLKKACEDVVSNKKLAMILRKLLAVGNLVNEGAGKPRARGITVDSLLKTAKRTGSDGKTTVIYLVIANFLKQDETGESVEFWKEMGSVRDATRIDIKDCKSSLREIQMGLKKVNISIDKEKAASAEATVESSFEYLKHSNHFIGVASEKVKEMEMKLVEVEESVKVLCSFFAEDLKTCQVFLFGFFLNLNLILFHFLTLFIDSPHHNFYLFRQQQFLLYC